MQDEVDIARPDIVLPDQHVMHAIDQDNRRSRSTIGFYLSNSQIIYVPECVCRRVRVLNH